MPLNFRLPTLHFTSPHSPISPASPSSPRDTFELDFDDIISPQSTQRHRSDFRARGHLDTPRHLARYDYNHDGSVSLAVSPPIDIPPRAGPFHTHTRSLPPLILLDRPPTPPPKRFSHPVTMSINNSPSLPPAVSPSTPFSTFRTNGLSRLKSLGTLTRGHRHRHHDTSEIESTTNSHVHVITSQRQMNSSRPAPPPPIHVQPPPARSATNSTTGHESSAMNPAEMFVRQTKIGGYDRLH